MDFKKKKKMASSCNIIFQLDKKIKFTKSFELEDEINWVFRHDHVIYHLSQLKDDNCENSLKSVKLKPAAHDACFPARLLAF